MPHFGRPTSRCWMGRLKKLQERTVERDQQRHRPRERDSSYERD